MGAGSCVTSDEFNVRGHRWTIQYYPKGDGGGGGAQNHGYASVLLSLASAGRADGVHVFAEFGLVDRALAAVRHSRTFSHTFRGRGAAHGCREFVRRAELAPSGCLADDRLVVRCSVRVVETELVGEGEVRSVRVPPPELHRDLGRVLLRDGVGADVTFVVRGEAFRAHRCVLAARSPVLRAELYAPMREGAEGAVVEVREVEPAAFAAMLHFIYTDSLPPETPAADGVNLAQHLLAAAERYALERLSLACQDRLSRHTDATTAADTYALASQHGVRRLEAAVIDFVTARQGRLDAVRASDGFRRLEQVDPAVAEEIVRRAAVARRRKAAMDVPAACLRMSGKICGSCVRWLANVWASCLRFLAVVWAYTRGHFPLVFRVLVAVLIFLVQHPEIVDGLKGLFRESKKLKRRARKTSKKLK